MAIKNILTVLTFFMVLLSGPFVAKAQENIIKADLLGIVKGVDRLIFEKSLIPHFSVLINVERGIYTSSRTQVAGGNGTGEIYNIKGYGVMPELRLYPFANKANLVNGIFIGAHYRHRWLSENFYVGIDPVHPDPSAEPMASTKCIMQDYGANLGYRLQWHFFTFEALVGHGNVSGEWQNPESREHIYPRIKKSELNESKFGLRTQLSIGFIFPYYKNLNKKEDGSKNTRTL